VSAVFRIYKVYVLAFAGSRKAIRSEKRIITGVDNKRWHCDRINKIERAAGFVIGIRIAKAMQRCRVAVIELAKVVDALYAFNVKTFHEPGLADNLLFETLEKSSRIKKVGRLRNLNAAAVEIKRDGESNSSLYLGWYSRALLTQVLQREVSAQAEADEVDFLETLLDAVGYEAFEIVCGTTMVESELLVHLIPAAAIIP
jgi:hypothetical protein